MRPAATMPSNAPAKPPPSRARSPRTIFITGTDTGVGKTTLTALLLAHLQANRVQALALKPFCSGDRADALTLQSLQDSALTTDEVNPWFYHEPLAPLAAGRAANGCPSLRVVLRHIRRVAVRCETLLVEGPGGLLVPLGERYTVVDLISALDCEVFVVAANRLGCINHTLLTVGALRARKCGPIRVILSNQRKPDLSASSNQRIIAQFLNPVPVFSMPFLGANVGRPETIKKIAKKLPKVLAEVVG